MRAAATHHTHLVQGCDDLLSTAYGVERTTARVGAVLGVGQIHDCGTVVVGRPYGNPRAVAARMAHT
jgi:hypothetical protein